MKAQYEVVVQLPIQGVGACTSGAFLVAIHGFLLVEYFPLMRVHSSPNVNLLMSSIFFISCSII